MQEKLENIFCVQFFAKRVCTLYFSLLIWNIGCNLTQRGGTSPTSFNSPLEIMKLFYGYWLVMFLTEKIRVIDRILWGD